MLPSNDLRVKKELFLTFKTSSMVLSYSREYITAPLKTDLTYSRVSSKGIDSAKAAPEISVIKLFFHFFER